MSSDPRSRRVLAVAADALLAAAGIALLVRQTMNALHVPGIDLVDAWNAAHQFVRTGTHMPTRCSPVQPGSALVSWLPSALSDAALRSR